MIVPIKPTLRYFAVILFGNKSNKICEPSNGGIGRRLKRKRKTLNTTPIHKTLIIILEEEAAINSANISAIKKRAAKIKLENGPANETKRSFFKGSLKFLRSIGIGFAQPIRMNPEVKAKNGITRLPTMSICFIGLRVSLPCFLAVSSPYLLATKAWEYSCIASDKKKNGRKIRNETSL